jgi:hypothetical protein
LNADQVIDIDAQRAAERRLAAFARALGAVRFFAATGGAPTETVTAAAQDYLGGLGLAGAGTDWVADLPEALALIQRADTDSAWRAAEDAHRAELTRQTDALLGRSKAAHLLNEAMRQASEAVTEKAAALAQGSAEPEAVKRAAAGAVIQTAYEMALAEAADAPAGDPFRCKFSLFTAGRWPLAVIGDRFHIY